jgi:hypothetical protein
MAPSAAALRGPATTTPPGDLIPLATELLVALVTASADRIRAASPVLSDLHRRLGHVLEPPSR